VAVFVLVHDRDRGRQSGAVTQAGSGHPPGRRTYVLGLFPGRNAIICLVPGRNAIICLVDAVLPDQDHEWPSLTATWARRPRRGLERSPARHGTG